MPEASSARTKGTEAPALADPAVVQALRVHAAQVELAQGYQKLLSLQVLGRPVVDIDRKTALALESRLSDPQTYEVLQLLWRESKFVSECDLFTMGFARGIPEDEITCWRLAVLSATAPAEVGRAHKRLQNIVEAACAYGLVEKRIMGAKKHTLHATRRLHELMMGVATHHVRVLAIRFGIGDEVEV